MATTNPILERAKAHLAEIAAHRRKLRVDEWDCDIYCSPLTLAERQKLMAFAQGKDLLLFAHAIIGKAEDADGKKLFSRADLPIFQGQVDSETVIRIGTWILDSKSLGDEDLGES